MVLWQTSQKKTKCRIYQGWTHWSGWGPVSNIKDVVFFRRTRIQSNHECSISRQQKCNHFGNKQIINKLKIHQTYQGKIFFIENKSGQNEVKLALSHWDHVVRYSFNATSSSKILGDAGKTDALFYWLSWNHCYNTYSLWPYSTSETWNISSSIKGVYWNTWP